MDDGGLRSSAVSSGVRTRGRSQGALKRFLRRGTRFLVAAVAGALGMLCVLAVSSAAYASPNNKLACGLASESSIRSLLGVAHSGRKHSSTSPTSPSPYNHTVGPGADESSCDTFGWSGQKPSPSTLRKIFVPGPSRYKIPGRLGIVSVTTYVRDPGTDGQNWDADKFYGNLWIAAVHVRHQVGGDFIKVPKAGASDRDALTLGHYGDFAEGIWQKGDSIVMLQVGAPHGQAAAKLRTLALQVVPKF